MMFGRFVFAESAMVLSLRCYGVMDETVWRMISYADAYASVERELK